jgi:hypothetical protein
LGFIDASSFSFTVGGKQKFDSLVRADKLKAALEL